MIKSFICYQGSKLKLLDSIKKEIDFEIDTLYDVFCGSGVVSFNLKAKKYVINDFGWTSIFLERIKNDGLTCFNNINYYIDKYKLNEVKLRSEFKDTKYKKDNLKLYKERFNLQKERFNLFKNNEDFTLNYDNIYKVYLRYVYSFSGVMYDRVGNGHIEKQKIKNIKKIINFLNTNEVKIFNKSFEDILSIQDKNGLYFIDPPYLITQAEYNKFWNEELEVKLYNEIEDKLIKNNIKFIITNTTDYKGLENKILKSFIERNKDILKITNLDLTYNIYNSRVKSNEILIKNF